MGKLKVDPDVESGAPQSISRSFRNEFTLKTLQSILESKISEYTFPSQKGSRVRCKREAKLPVPPSGRWGEVRHDNKVNIDARN